MITVMRFVLDNLTDGESKLLLMEFTKDKFNLDTNFGFLSVKVIENKLNSFNSEGIYNKSEIAIMLQRIVDFLNGNDFGNLFFDFGDYRLTVIKELRDKRFFMYIEKDDTLYLPGYRAYYFGCPRCGFNSGNIISLHNNNDFSFDSVRGIGTCLCGFSDIIEEFICKYSIEEYYIKLKMDSYTSRKHV